MKFLITIIFIMLITLPIFGVVPSLIPVQGVLTEVDGTPVVGNINLTLSLYDSETNVNELWKEQRNDFAVENGYISLYLGEVTELSPSVISTADELWLEIIFNNERMPRVRLASVPFALEAINAQKAKQIGDITESQISNMFNSGCAEGYYLKGYDVDGNAVCAVDKTGEATESVTYSAGNGIIIDENNNISVSNNLYSAGNGIKVESGMISVDTSKVADALHDHNTLYYEKSNNASNNNLVKFAGNPASGYKLENSGISEANGELTVGSLISNGNITTTGNIIANKIPIINSTTINNTGTITTENITANTGNFNLLYSGYINVAGGELVANTVRTKTIYFANGSDGWAGVSTTFKGFKQIEIAELGAPGWGLNWGHSFYIKADGTHTSDANDTTVLKDSNSMCYLSSVQFHGLNYDDDKARCKVFLDGGKWKLETFANYAWAGCQARCLIWSW